ncbi:hypothetical protein DRW03_14870 [Corallococcus sp. H22C18031201]|uniref:Imm49 family immunity protein n=1 Tax=Citreicoccus inhibens TaxID=2849499 RepID=UPI000E70A95D|nr:immunity 49 family protein [Citreicoccus inhibens]MBU8895373.1 immunity 49 family protein [Citreicoccus inhibens]RJS22584.1 hypothetical protein DRW03_14870 [Corallococcus sp. H22C18031201]
MSHDYVDVARYNMSLSLHASVEGMALQDESLAHHISNACVTHRVLGICALLLNADADTFAASLCKAGQARHHLLTLTQTRAIPTELRLGSDTVGFSDALAAGDLPTAREIALLSSRHHIEGMEYEEDFLFAHFLHQMMDTRRSEDALHRVLTHWEAVLEGGLDPRREVCHALLLKDVSAFEAAFTSLLSERKREFTEYRRRPDFDAEVGATTGRIHVDGLALLRLAELEGLPPLPALEFVPALARVPRGTPLPPAQSWRTA